jgi:hypothetical protein
MAAPVGNRNAAKAKVWTAAIERALERRQGLVAGARAIDDLADQLLDECMRGNLMALQELGNRLEGKPAQGITLSGDEDNPLQHNHTVTFIGDR